MADNILQFEVEADLPSAGNRLASDLKRMLEETVESISVARSKADPETLDLGTLITIVVSSPFALAAVKAVTAWLMKHPEGTLTVEIEEGEGRKKVRLNARGLTDEQLEKAVGKVLRRD